MDGYAIRNAQRTHTQHVSVSDSAAAYVCVRMWIFLPYSVGYHGFSRFQSYDSKLMMIPFASHTSGWSEWSYGVVRIFVRARVQLCYNTIRQRQQQQQRKKRDTYITIYIYLSSAYSVVFGGWNIQIKCEQKTYTKHTYSLSHSHTHPVCRLCICVREKVKKAKQQLWRQAGKQASEKRRRNTPSAPRQKNRIWKTSLSKFPFFWVCVCKILFFFSWILVLLFSLFVGAPKTTISNWNFGLEKGELDNISCCVVCWITLKVSDKRREFYHPKKVIIKFRKLVRR